jgi:hypothetical protein
VPSAAAPRSYARFNLTLPAAILLFIDLALP